MCMGQGGSGFFPFAILTPASSKSGVGDQRASRLCVERTQAGGLHGVLVQTRGCVWVMAVRSL